MFSSNSISSALPLEPWAKELIKVQTNCEKNYPQGYNQPLEPQPITQIDKQSLLEPSLQIPLLKP